MPDWENYYFSYGTVTSPDIAWSTSFSTSAEQIQQQYEEYVQECKRQDIINEQRMREAEEEAEDRKKYPLFYWRETCKGIK